MDRRERQFNMEETLRLVFAGLQSGLWTCLPGEVWDVLDDMRVNVQPTIRMMVRPQVGNDYTPLQLPLILDCPIQFAAGGGCTFTFPLERGNEGLIIFSSRCIDSWWVQSGVQNPSVLRMHDLSDGFFIPGVKSKPNTFAYSPTTARLTTDDGQAYYELDPTGKIANIIAPGGVNINNVSIDTDGNIVTPGEVTARGAGAVALSTHVHTGVQLGDDESGEPVI